MSDISPILLANRTILVTGAGDGIGKAAAISFAKHGATVILLGKTTAKLTKVSDEICDLGYPEPAILPANLSTTNPEDYQAIHAAIADNFDRLDGILHNAAILGSLTPITFYPIEQWYQVFQVNLHAPFILTQALLPLLKKASDASIVFTSSNVGEKGKAYWGAYSASKCALNGFMEVLADELQENTAIRVNSINPKRVRTRMRAKAYPAESPMQNPAPEEIMKQYLFLMGPDSIGITGQQLIAEVSDDH